MSYKAWCEVAEDLAKRLIQDKNYPCEPDKAHYYAQELMIGLSQKIIKREFTLDEITSREKVINDLFKHKNNSKNEENFFDGGGAIV